MSTVRVSKVPPLVSTLKWSPFWVILLTYTPSRTSKESPLAVSRCFLKLSASAVPDIEGKPIQFWISSETTDCPPNSAVSSIVFSRLRAAYTPAAVPPGPAPTIMRSYIEYFYFPLERRRKAGIDDQSSEFSSAPFSDSSSGSRLGFSVTVFTNGSSFCSTFSPPDEKRFFFF